MAKYKITHESGDTTIMIADLAQASAQIEFLDEEGERFSSPFQTADARHDKRRAAELLVGYFNSGSGDHDPVESVELIEED
jgi:hypothetical protein